MSSLTAPSHRTWSAPLARVGLIAALGAALLFPATFWLHIWSEGGRGGDRGLAALMFVLILHVIALAASLVLRWAGAISHRDRDPLMAVVVREFVYAILIAALLAIVCWLTVGAYER